MAVCVCDRCVSVLLVVCVCVWQCACAEQVSVQVQVFVQEDSHSILQGHVLQDSAHTHFKQLHNSQHTHTDLHAPLRLIRDEDEEKEVISHDDGDDAAANEEQKTNPWIGVVPVEMEETASNSNQESFTTAVVNKMKRALVLGASALIILVLNQNTVREMDLSQVLSKPIIIIQTSENVTRLIGALLRGLHATAKITYKTFLQNNLGATLTLWSSCGRSRGGLYGEWQGVICTGETNSPVQKYLQQLWNTVVLVALIFSTGVIVHARWQYQDNQFNDELQLHSKQDLLNRLSTLKTRTYRRPRTRCDPTHTPPETDSCVVCLEQYNNNQCLRVLPCLHEFHRDCVDPWLLLQQTCPLCKRSVLGNFC